jgi:hypothetical protein
LTMFNGSKSYLFDRFRNELSLNLSYICWVSFALVTVIGYFENAEWTIYFSNLVFLTKVNLAHYTTCLPSSFQVLSDNFAMNIQPFTSSVSFTVQANISSLPGQFQNMAVSLYSQIHQLHEKILFVPLGISVIVPTLNEEKYITRCLKSLSTQIYKGHYEIIVVDAASTDRTVELAEEYADKVLVRPGPAGFARNEGARAAKDDIYAFLDADTMASPQWLEKMDESFNANVYVPCVTGPTYPYEGGRWDMIAYVIATQWLSRVSARAGIPHVPGFNCAYRKKPFWKVGGFDEKRRLSEDIILSTNIRKEGKVKFNKEMVAYTSLRRIKKHGYVYLTTFYVINGLIAITFKETMPHYTVVR